MAVTTGAGSAVMVGTNVRTKMMDDDREDDDVDDSGGDGGDDSVDECGA